MTKAQEIYRKVTARDRNEMRIFGIEEKAVRLTSEDWTVTTRTINEIEKINEREKKAYKIDVEKLGFDRDEIIEQSIKNIELAIKAWRASEALWKKILES